MYRNMARTIRNDCRNVERICVGKVILVEGIDGRAGRYGLGVVVGGGGCAANRKVGGDGCAKRPQNILRAGIGNSKKYLSTGSPDYVTSTGNKVATDGRCGCAVIEPDLLRL